jgi:hypothetical protein
MTEDAGLPVAPDQIAKSDAQGINGANDYTEAMRLLAQVDPATIRRGLAGIDQVLSGKSDVRDRRDANVALEACSPAIEEAVAGSVCDRCVFPILWDQPDPVPELGPMVTLGKLLAGRAALESDITDLLAASYMARHLGSLPLLAAEGAQDESINAVCDAAWEIGRHRPDQSAALQGLLNVLPDADLADRIGGELIWARSRCHTDEEQIDVLQRSRELYGQVVQARTWPEIEDVLAGVDDPRWRQTAEASRRAQERRSAALDALKMLERPTGFQNNDGPIEM